MAPGCLLSASIWLLVLALLAWFWLGLPVVAVVMFGVGAALAARVVVYGIEGDQ